MIGTSINALAILIGGMIALTTKKEMSTGNQNLLKVLLGGLAIVFGFLALWQHINGGFVNVLLQLFLVLISMSLGQFLGKQLRLQKGLNRLGSYAQDRYARAGKEKGNRFNDGFVVCTIVFCTGPMAVVGALMDGMFNDFKLLLLKAVMDGLAVMSFARVFGWGALLSAVPVFIFQGTIALFGAALGASVSRETDIPYGAISEILGATSGLIMVAIGLVVLEVKKIRLADYLPGLPIAAVLGWWLL